MRRLALVLAVLAVCGSVLLGVAGAGAAGKPWPVVVDGVGHVSATKVEGWYFVKDTAAVRSRASKVYVGVSNPKGSTFLGYRMAPSLRPGKRHRSRFSYQLPKVLEAGAWRINVCTGGHCLHAGRFTIPAAGGSGSARGKGSGGSGRGESGGSGTGPGIGTPSSGTGSPTGETVVTPVSTMPTDPIAYPVAEPFFHQVGGGVEYWGFVPRSYDGTNGTPTRLFVFLHGCGGDSEGDAWVVDPGAEEGVEQDWLTLSLGGRDGGCWNPLAETEPWVMAAIADFETHFNVDRGEVVLGGYSSGGDLAYRTAFKHSSTFAELLIENSAPFRDTEANEAELLGAATTRFPIVHLAHTGDETYKLAEVEPEIEAVREAGFPVQLIKRPGGHSDSHTDPDLINFLLPHIDEVG
jgi:pimeloyl-ACP methyl ester carboxylesterase